MCNDTRRSRVSRSASRSVCSIASTSLKCSRLFPRITDLNSPGSLNWRNWQIRWCTSLTRTRPVRRVRTSGTTVSYGDSFPRENGSTAIPQRRSRILRSGATACRGGSLDTELRMKFSKQSLTGFIERRSRRRHPNLFGLPYGYSVINVQLVIAIKCQNVCMPHVIVNTKPTISPSSVIM